MTDDYRSDLETLVNDPEYFLKNVFDAHKRQVDLFYLRKSQNATQQEFNVNIALGDVELKKLTDAFETAKIHWQDFEDEFEDAKRVFEDPEASESQFVASIAQLQRAIVNNQIARVVDGQVVFNKPKFEVVGNTEAKILFYDGKICNPTAGFLDLRNTLFCKSLVANFGQLVPQFWQIAIFEPSLQTISSKLFENMVNLTRVELVGTQLSSLDPTLFDSTVNLKKLSMSRNKQLTTLPANIFKNLRKLQDLVLAENKFQSFDVNTFKGLEMCQKVDLIRNELSCLPPDFFAQICRLTRLNIYSNENFDAVCLLGARGVEINANVEQIPPQLQLALKNYGNKLVF